MSINKKRLANKIPGNRESFHLLLTAMLALAVRCPSVAAAPSIEEVTMEVMELDQDLPEINIRELHLNNKQDRVIQQPHHFKQGKARTAPDAAVAAPGNEAAAEIEYIQPKENAVIEPAGERNPATAIGDQAHSRDSTPNRENTFEESSNRPYSLPELGHTRRPGREGREPLESPRQRHEERMEVPVIKERLDQSIKQPIKERD